MIRKLGWPTAVALLSLWAAAPLWAAPFFASDDGLFHLYRIAALNDALRQGEFYPRLFPSFAYGYGQAVLAYYGPLSYYAGVLFLRFGAGTVDALKLAFAFGYAASGVAFFALAWRYVPALPALCAAVAYVYFPYRIVETYQRGALAEHLAFVFLPLILLPVGRRSLTFALSLFALVVTHSLTAMIALPFALLWQWFAVPAQERGLPRLGRLSVHVVLALGLSAFYWLPVALQSRWVGLSAGLENQGYLAHLAPLWSFVQPALAFRYAPDQIVAADHPLAPVSLALLVLALASAIAAWRACSNDAPMQVLAALLAGGALFMLSDLSNPIWLALHNPLTFLQYPWRFMTLAALGIALGAGFALARLGARGSVAALLLVPFLVWAAMANAPLKALPAPASDDAAMWQTDFQNRQIGATWTAEYMPWWVQADRTAIPAALRAPVSTQALPVDGVEPLAAGYTSRAYQVSAAASGPAVLRFHQFYLPQWRVTLDGRPLAAYPSTELGLLTVELPPGSAGRLDVTFALLPLEQAAVWISVLCAAAGAWWLRGRALAVVVAVAIVAGVVLAWPSPVAPPPLAIGAQLGDAADLVAARTDRADYRPGDTVRVTLTWLARRPIAENFKSFVHVGAPMLAQSDSDPGGAFTPTSRWAPGELVEDTRVLTIPDGTPPGTLPLFAGLYRFETRQNLPAARAGVLLPDDRVPIGAIRIVSR
ncbi:MAG: hypothetical protein HZB53_01745 [Chloroflexi bacterium]|nr:hypothetical protein [Chloroflexota bacterium]